MLTQIVMSWKPHAFIEKATVVNLVCQLREREGEKVGEGCGCRGWCGIGGGCGVGMGCGCRGGVWV